MKTELLSVYSLRCARVKRRKNRTHGTTWAECRIYTAAIDVAALPSRNVTPDADSRSASVLAHLSFISLVLEVFTSPFLKLCFVKPL